MIRELGAAVSLVRVVYGLEDLTKVPMTLTIFIDASAWIVVS